MDRKQRLKELAAEFSECKRALNAIGDETRQLIILALIEGETKCEEGIRVGDLTAMTHLSRPAVSHHLKLLKDANIIGMTQKGTMNFYYVDIEKSDVFKLKQLFDNVVQFIHDVQQQSVEEG